MTIDRFPSQTAVLRRLLEAAGLRAGEGPFDFQDIAALRSAGLDDPDQLREAMEGFMATFGAALGARGKAELLGRMRVILVWWSRHGGSRQPDGAGRVVTGSVGRGAVTGCAGGVNPTQRPDRRQGPPETPGLPSIPRCGPCGNRLRPGPRPRG